MNPEPEDAVGGKTPTDDQLNQSRSTHPAILMIAGVACTLLVLGVCICSGSLWWFRPRIFDDSQHAKRVLTEIVDVQIPEIYTAKGTIEWNFAMAIRVRGVYFERIYGDGLLTFIEVNSRFATDDDVRNHIRQTLIEKGGGGTALIVEDSKTEQVEVPINGETVVFQFEVARDPPSGSGRIFHLVEGTFNGKNGDVLLAMQVNDESWDRESVVEMLRSIGNAVPDAKPRATQDYSPLPEPDRIAPERLEQTPNETD